MHTKTKAVLIAFIVVSLPVCWTHGQETASGAKAPAKGAESASGANTSGAKPETSGATDKAAMTRVTGIGGVFIKAKEPAKLRAWYKTHLGIDVQTWGGATFHWVDAAGAPTKGQTAWFVGNGSSFAPSESSFMIDYRVADLRGLLKVLREEGCQVLDKVDQSDFGIFGWVMDPEGNKVELWQPPEGK